jgi:pyridoxamine 5'-phosphate oxidase
VFDFNIDPFIHFENLFDHAQKKQVPDPNAMTLSTVNEAGRPTNRIVLFKGIIRGGFSFFTNYQGQKAMELEKNAFASICFFWPTLEQQIRIEGLTEKVTRAESEAYFASRPRLSQLGAWASNQSTVISGTSEFLEKVEKYDKQFAGQDVPCPPHWGGYILRPDRFEFWFGRQGRLHERFVYRKGKNDKSKGPFSAGQGEDWVKEQLSP